MQQVILDKHLQRPDNNQLIAPTVTQAGKVDGSESLTYSFHGNCMHDSEVNPAHISSNRLKVTSSLTCLLQLSPDFQGQQDLQSVS